MATHLVLFAILLVSLTAALIGALSYTRARRALEGEARRRLSLLAQNVADHLHRELEDRAADITNWAHLEVMKALLYHDVDKQLAQFMRQIVSGRRTYRAIAGLDANGRVVASAGSPIPPLATGVPFRTRLSAVAASTGTRERDLRLETAVADPEQAEVPIGALVVLLDDEGLLDRIQASVEPTGVRPSLIVRTADGNVILPPAGASTESLSASAADESGLLRGSARVGALTGVDGPELEVTVAEPIGAALVAVTSLRATLIRVSALVLVFSSVLGALVAWWISSPIRRLTGTVHRITARGRLDGDEDFPQARGEIGVLATAFRRMMESLMAAQAEALAQSRRAFLGEIAANISHEIRTPLSVLKTSAQLLARQELPAAEQRKLAGNVAAEVDRLNRVVTDLVDLARPTPVRHREESLVEIVRKAMAFFAPQAAKLGVTVSLEAADSSVRVHGSADQLYQVLLNLIHNALQAMGGPGCLIIDCHREQDWGVVELRDTGPGFSPEILSRAFSPFYSTKADGTGLGLAISKRIVEEHGGTIAVENQRAGGARVCICLPHREATA